MPIKKITPQKQIEQNIMQVVDKKKGVLIDVFCYIGESCIIEARNGGTYGDRTGNLRSSIGYVVLDNGRIVRKGGCQKVKQGGSSGASEGDKFLSQLIAKNKKGIVLIVVAGMNYASYVEAKGYNVITSAELLAKSLIPQMMVQLGFTIQ